MLKPDRLKLSKARRVESGVRGGVGAVVVMYGTNVVVAGSAADGSVAIGSAITGWASARGAIAGWLTIGCAIAGLVTIGGASSDCATIAGGRSGNAGGITDDGTKIGEVRAVESGGGGGLGW